MKFAITGGAGFLGANLVRTILAAGDEVVVIDKRSPRWNAANAPTTTADVSDPRAMIGAVEGCDVVIHAAFAPPYAASEEQERVNSGGVSTVLDAAAAAGVGRVIVVSSTIVERIIRTPAVRGNGPAGRLATYARTRRDGEAAALARTDLSVGVARPRTLVGSGAVGAFALQFRNIAEGRPVVLLGAATSPYQLLHIADFANALIMFGHSAHVGVLSFGSRSSDPLRDELSALAEHAGTGSQIVTTPAAIGRMIVRGAPRIGLRPLGEIYEAMLEGRAVQVDNMPAERAIGWRPQWSNLDALIDAYDWFLRSSGEEPNHPIPRSHEIGIRVLSALPRGKRS